MPVDGTKESLLVVAVGGAAAVVGGASTALSETMTRRQVFATMLSSLGLGCFLPPALTAFYAFDWRVAGAIGFTLGLGCCAVCGGLRKITKRFEDKPGNFIPHIRDAMKDDSPAAGTGGTP